MSGKPWSTPRRPSKKKIPGNVGHKGFLTGRSSTGIRCVYWDAKRQKYKVELFDPTGKRIFIGRFDDIAVAEREAEIAAAKYNPKKYPPKGGSDEKN